MGCVFLKNPGRQADNTQISPWRLQTVRSIKNALVIKGYFFSRMVVKSKRREGKRSRIHRKSALERKQAEKAGENRPGIKDFGKSLRIKKKI
jgi:hypothetical protein